MQLFFNKIIFFCYMKLKYRCQSVSKLNSRLNRPFFSSYRYFKPTWINEANAEEHIQTAITQVMIMIFLFCEKDINLYILNFKCMKHILPYIPKPCLVYPVFIGFSLIFSVFQCFPGLARHVFTKKKNCFG